MQQPSLKPKNPNFSSGPCAKFPNWSLDLLKDAPFGRSHRAKIGKAKLKLAIDMTAELLRLPKDYRVAIVPASDTGAVEMAMWSLLGQRPIDVLAWESFSQDWVTDIKEQLKLNPNVLTADYGLLPDLSKVNFDNDVVFAWNGTTSGVKVPNADWIPENRTGLTICDATSAVFAQEMDYSKLDVITYSWQKVLGGEAAHGMLILSPRAVERLETYTPSVPLPKIFRMVKKGKLDEELFQGSTINTPSMLCVEDYLACLKWANEIGGLDAMIQRANNNFNALNQWVDKTSWVDFLAKNPETRSNTSVCLTFCGDVLNGLSAQDKTTFTNQFVKFLETHHVAYDIAPYRTAPLGLRIWCGATIETSDIKILCQWFDYAYASVKDSFLKAA
jgi:phosphoserine aminotransferase